jgi:thiamine pyrophosphate-dependent acetolactate synthase large subunit-like protein
MESKFRVTNDTNIDTWDKWMEQDMNQESTPIRPERLMKSISKYSDDDAVFSIDVGTSWADWCAFLIHILFHPFIPNSFTF